MVDICQGATAVPRVLPNMPYSGWRPTTRSNFDANTNRLVESAGQVGYDATGNQTTHGGWTLAYDAEGRIKTATPSSGNAATYEYDGDGRRVKKTTDGVSTYFVHDAFGHLAAEYSSAGPSGSPETHYLTTDHLGSTRLVTNQTGAVVSRHDYLPYGWELYSGLTGRTNGQGYLTSPESVATPTQRFTGKERDTVETGLDYFGARYFSGAMGRFTGPDPQEFNKRTISNPQKWNRYAYVLNNPLALIDPDGKEEIRVTIRAFIPESNFRYPAGIGPMWKGDGRSFSAGASASSRAQVTFTIETDPSKSVRPLVSDPTFKTSGSAVNVYGLFTATANSDVTGTVGTNTRMSDGTSVVSLSMTASDPLIPGAPPTGGNFTFNVAPDGSSVSMNGTIAAYPAFEVYVQNGTTGAQGTLLQYTPAGTSANRPGALLTGATVPVRGTTTLPNKPQCTTGDPNCK